MQKLIAIFVSAVLITACVSVSETAKQKYRQGTTLWDQGDKQQAISFLQQAVTDSPEYFDAYAKLGEYHFANGNYQNAAVALEKAAELNDRDPAVVILLGQSYLQAKEYLKGQHRFSQAMNLKELTEDQKFQAHLGKGICKLYLTLYEDAQEYLQKALSMRPNDSEAIFNSALLREKQMGPNAGTMSDYKKVLTKKPKHLNALQRIGDSLRNLEQHQKAIEYYRQYLAAGGQDDGIKDYIKERENRRKIVEQSGGIKVTEDKKLFVCPQCGRIYKQGQGICDYDGSPLVPQE